MKKLKRAAACLASAVMLAGSIGITETSGLITCAAENNNLLVDFDFENIAAGDTITGGSAKATGDYTLQDSYTGSGKAMYLDGSASNFLTVTDKDGESILSGLEEMTISYEFKPDRDDTNWLFYAAANNNAQVGDNEQYIGAVYTRGGNAKAERYNNIGSRPVSPEVSCGFDWAHIDIVMSAADIAVYVNGVEKGRAASEHALKYILGYDSIFYIGKANWGSGEFCKGWIDNYKVYNKALTEEEIQNAASEAFGAIALPEAMKAVEDITIDSETIVLPGYNGTVMWKSDMKEIEIGPDGCTANVKQPETGGEPLTGKLTAIVTKYGKTGEREVNVTIKPYISPDTPYGYLMVHFVEDSAGYAEKIYLDISRGDNPEQWDPLNNREPILASNLGTTGARDPFITYNPENETYYIIATDLRVFGGTRPTDPNENEWAYWGRCGSTMMNVWESKDLINWSNVRQFDVTKNAEGESLAELGNMYAPEATWVPDYYGEGKGAFVVYWSSERYADEAHTVNIGHDVMWGATTDFTQETFEYGGVFLNGGERGWIDTTILQDNGKTYHITKSHAEEIIMESTEVKEWWKAKKEDWTRLQSRIGVERYGAVEGPAVFKDHSKENSYYLFVDDLPVPGYQLMHANNLEASGWQYMDSKDYFLTPYTKHGGVISLTKGTYDNLRKADAIKAVETDFGQVMAVICPSDKEVLKALPKTAKVKLGNNMGEAELPIVWETNSIDTNIPGVYPVKGVVQSIGRNQNQWVGYNNSTDYNAKNKRLYSSTEIIVEAQVKVAEFSFEDVAENDWFYNAVYHNYMWGIMTGLDPEHFGPYEKLARAQFAVLVSRLNGEEEMEYEALFPDVKEGEWYTNAVLWAADAGIITGYSDTGLFGPADRITREQMAVMMYRFSNYLGYDISIRGDIDEFLDGEDVSDFAREAMEWAVGEKIITGKEDGLLLDPQGNASRAECAVIIQRFMDVSR